MVKEPGAGIAAVEIGDSEALACLADPVTRPVEKLNLGCKDAQCALVAGFAHVAYAKPGKDCGVLCGALAC